MNIPLWIDYVRKERDRQNDKWGVQNYSPALWLAILGEEYGEACKAMLEGRRDAFIAELVQVMAVAAATIECIERNGTEFQDVTALQQENFKLRDRIDKLNILLAIARDEKTQPEIDLYHAE